MVVGVVVDDVVPTPLRVVVVVDRVVLELVLGGWVAGPVAGQYASAGPASRQVSHES